MNEILEEDLDNLKHMLGMNYSKKNWGSRNYFTVYIGDGGNKSINRLLEKGLVCKHYLNSETIEYSATEQGCIIAGLNKRQTKKALNFWK